MLSDKQSHYAALRAHPLASCARIVLKVAIVFAVGLIFVISSCYGFFLFMRFGGAIAASDGDGQKALPFHWVTFILIGL